MATGTKISWTEATWNPIVGCSVVSPGCTNCYAMRMASRLELMGQKSYVGLTMRTKAGPVWNGITRVAQDAIFAPLFRKKPTIYFVNSMSDLFHEGVADGTIDLIFAVMAMCPQHIFQILTKRPARMRAYLTGKGGGDRQDVRNQIAFVAVAKVLNACAPGWGSEHIGGPWRSRGIQAGTVWPLPNVWLGVSAEDQKRADERIPHLLATPAALRWVSAEPLLGAIDFRPWIFHFGTQRTGGIRPRGDLHWIVVGGESGPNARPMHPDWPRQIRDDCAAADVVFYFKQWGAWIPYLDRERDDSDWRADYRYKLSDSRPGISWLNIDGGRGFHGDRFHVMRRVGAKKAGFELDGQTHRDLPQVAA